MGGDILGARVREGEPALEGREWTLGRTMGM
jgi:hypothetical protein